MSVIRLALVCSAFLLAVFSAGAQSVPASSPGPVSYPISTVRNVATLGAGSVSSANVGRYAFAVATGGLVVADASTGMPLPDGRSFPVSVQSHIPKATVAGALGRFARKTLPVLSVGVALYDLGQELGFTLDNSSGELVVSVPSPGTCTTAPCYSYQCLTGSYCSGAGRKNSPIEAAQVVIGQNHYGCKAATVSVRMHPSSPGDWQYNGSGVSYPSGPATCSLGWNNLGKYSRAPDTEPSFTPSTVQAFEDAIAARSGWPTSSALARATVDAINSGESLAAEPQAVTGPATSPGPVTTTVDTINNTTTTSTTTHNHTYDGPQVTTTTTTTNITIDNSTGNVINNTTTTSEPVLPETETPDYSFNDTALPAVPSLYEPKYPDGLVGVWNSKKAQLDAAPLVAQVGDLMPDVGTVGTCPVWTMPLDFGFFNAGVLDFSIPCWIWDFARVIVIVSALILARALVFGG